MEHGVCLNPRDVGKAWEGVPLSDFRQPAQAGLLKIVSPVCVFFSVVFALPYRQNKGATQVELESLRLNRSRGYDLFVTLLKTSVNM